MLIQRPRIIFILFLTLSTQAHAAKQLAHGFQKGFYLGGGLGAGWGHADWNGVSKVSAANNNGASLTIFESWTPDGKSSVTEMARKILGGFQFIDNSLYVAAEMGLSLSGQYHFDLNDTKDFNAFYLTPLYTNLEVNAIVSDEVTLGNFDFTLDLKPGWLITDRFLVNARVGLAVNELTIKNSGSWTNTASFFGVPTVLMAEDSSQTSNIVCGIRLGLGTEYLIQEHLGITLDYAYTNYGNITTTAKASANGNTSGIDQLNVDGLDAPDVGVSTQTLMLGMLYHW